MEKTSAENAQSSHLFVAVVVARGLGLIGFHFFDRTFSIIRS
jgi:hypothetical protein